MYASFYEFFKYTFGIDLPFLSLFKVFGFLMALSFVAAAYLLYVEFRRLEDAGLLKAVKETHLIGVRAQWYEVLLQSVVGFVLFYKLGWIVQHLSEFTRAPEQFIANTQGNLWAGIIGAVAMGAYFYYDKNRQALPHPQQVQEMVYPHQRVMDIVVIAALFGVLGSKVFSSLENWNDFVRDPLGSLLSFSGLTFYGGLIFATIALTYFARKKQIPLLRFMDATAPGLILAYGIGRLGCHFAGDGDWGIVNTAAKPAFLPQWLWAFDYPHNVAKEGVPIPNCEGEYCFVLQPPVFPTPLYEFALGLLIAAILWRLRKKLTPYPGLLFALYLIFNGIERFSIEAIRVNPRYDVLGLHLSLSQIIALGLVAAGLAMYFLLRKRYTPKPQ